MNRRPFSAAGNKNPVSRSSSLSRQRSRPLPSSLSVEELPIRPITVNDIAIFGSSDRINSLRPQVEVDPVLTEAYAVLALGEKAQLQKERERKKREQQEKLDELKKLVEEEKKDVELALEGVQIHTVLLRLQEMDARMIEILDKNSEALYSRDMEFLKNYEKAEIPLVLNGISCTMNKLDEVIRERIEKNSSDKVTFEQLLQILKKLSTWSELRDKLDTSITDALDEISSTISFPDSASRLGSDKQLINVQGMKK